MRDLRAAVVFLTRIPVRYRGQPTIAEAVPWFPFVGALVGAVVGGALAGLVHPLPALVSASVAVLFGVLLTGAFHEDGLADVADAFAGAWTRPDRMRVLRDPLHGSYGVAAMCGSILVRVVCLGSIGVSPAAAFGCTIAAHTLGRTGAVALMTWMPVARPDGLGAEYAALLKRQHALLGAGSGVVIALIATGWWTGPFLLATAAGTAAVGWLSHRKLGGITGDVLGAAEQVVECLVLVVASGLALHHRIWWH